MVLCGVKKFREIRTIHQREVLFYTQSFMHLFSLISKRKRYLTSNRSKNSRTRNLKAEGVLNISPSSPNVTDKEEDDEDMGLLS